MDSRQAGRLSEPSLTRWNPDDVPRIRQLPRVDRPREKLVSRGAEALSDVELLAVLLGAGTRRLGVLELATRILAALGPEPEALDVPALEAIPGVGRAKACQIVAALEFAKRHLQRPRVTIEHPSDALPYLQSIRDKKQEHFVCLSLTGANEVIASRVVTVGLLDTNQVHPREVFADPIADRAASVLLAHNHPSGTLEASPEDLALTRRLKQAGHLLGIRVLDHVIVTRDGFLSLQHRGLL
jgi:DNA repair protein RadC